MNEYQLNQIEQRLAGLEAVAYASNHTRDFGPAVKSLEEQLKTLRNDTMVALETAKRNRPADIGHLATKAELVDMAKMLADQVMQNDDAVKASVGRDLRDSIGTAAAKATQAADIAATTARHSADMLRTKAQIFAQ